MDFGQKYCQKCGTLLASRPLENEGLVPYCEQCGEFRFPMYNVAVSMIVTDEKSGDILLIQQYGREAYILVAGYISRGERAEDAVVREIKEETGLTVSRIRFIRTKFFEKSNTLMCNFTAWIRDRNEISPNGEIDRYQWFAPTEARKAILHGSLAEEFLIASLDEA